MKPYLMYDLNDSSKYRVVYKNKRPKGSLGVVPLDPLTGKAERAEWLQIENVEQEDGSFKEMVTVDQVKKVAGLKAIKDNREARKSKRNKRKALIRKLKEFKKEDVVGLEQIQEQLEIIIKYLRGD